MAGLTLNRRRQAPAEETPSFGSIAERFRRAGDLDRAIALCQEGLKKFPNQLSARVTLGWSYLDKGEYDLARQELERVIRRAPDNLAAIRGLAELHDRAEHAVSGLGPDGMWVPEELAGEPEPTAAPIQPPAAQPTPAATRMAPATDRAESPAALPSNEPLPVPVLSASEDVNPLSLIETPAQAAVAHVAAQPAAPVASVFEQMVDPAAEAVRAATGRPVEEAAAPVQNARNVVPVVEDATSWTVEDALAASEGEVALETIGDESWGPANAPPEEAGAETDAVLFAGNAEDELARMASELNMAAVEAVTDDIVIDLPEEQGALEGAMRGFEEPSLTSEPAAADNAWLDPLLAPAVVDATDELEALGSVFAASTAEPESDEVVDLSDDASIELPSQDVDASVAAHEPEPFFATAPDQDAAGDAEPAAVRPAEPAADAVAPLLPEATAAEIPPVEAPGSELEPEPFYAEAVPAEAAPAEVAPEVAAESVAAPPVEPAVEEQAGDPDLIAAEDQSAAPAEETEPIHHVELPVILAPQPQVADVVLEDAVSDEGPAEVVHEAHGEPANAPATVESAAASDLAPQPEPEPQLLPAGQADEADQVLAAEPDIAPVLDAAADNHEAAEEAGDDPPDDSSELDTWHVEAPVSAESFDEVDGGPEADDEASVRHDLPGWTLPDVGWSPAGEGASAPVAAARLTEPDHHDLFPLPPERPPLAAGRARPIAALEAFLHKVHARRLHASPESMA